MAEYDDENDAPNKDYRLIGGPPAESGWTLPVRPLWIHDLLDLWEREKLMALFLELGGDRMAQDIANANTRRRTLVQIARYFVPTKGGGRLRRTASPNVWAAYSQIFAAPVLAPAYLLHIAGQNNMARALAGLLHEEYAPGDAVELGDVRRHLCSRFGDRRSVRDSAGALLRTLEHFGVLARAGRVGDYRFIARLPVAEEAFPLLVWAWRQTRDVHTADVIDLEAFATDPLLTFVEQASYAAHWAAFTESLWMLEVRDARPVAILRHTDNAAFIRTLFNLLASHPKWPAVKKQFPPEPS